MRAVILVPRRADGGHRDALWAWCRAWWERTFPDLPIYEGHHDDGLFNRAAALNAAAAAAGAWDVALIIDGDVLGDPPTIRQAIADAFRYGDRMVMAFDQRHNLDARGTRLVMDGYRGSWRRYVGKTYRNMVSACVAVARPLWDAVHGFDEQFVGWGFEDNAFAAACQSVAGHPPVRLRADLWHLWHPTAPEGRRGTPSFMANKARAERYHAALVDPAAMHRLIAGAAGSVAQRPAERIPRILHRTVPAHTTPQVEAWWQGFAAYHDGWEMRTWRDPLDPADFPISSPSWSACTTGAQRAGLIRLEALWHHGGIYVDSDCEPYRSLEPLLGLHAFAAWEDRNVVPDAVIGAEPRHPAIRKCLDIALVRVPDGAWESGPGVLTEVLPARDDVLLLPPGSFYPYHYKAKHLAGRDHAGEQPWSFMAHHWAGSWLPKAAAVAHRRR